MLPVCYWRYRQDARLGLAAGSPLHCAIAGIGQLWVSPCPYAMPQRMSVGLSLPLSAPGLFVYATGRWCAWRTLLGQALEAFEGAGGEQVGQGTTVGQVQVGGQFGQWIEDEGAGVHVVVRHVQARVVQHQVAE